MRKLLFIAIVVTFMLSATGCLKSSEEITQEPTKESAEKPTEEPTQESTKESAEKPTKEPTQESTKESAQQPTKESAQESTKESAQQPTKEPTQESTKESAEKPTKESTQEPTKESAEEPTKESAQEDNNPFEQQDEEFLPSSLGHEPANVVTDENNKRVPLQYDGGEFKLDYFVQASGSSKNVGFLVYLNGVPQPYKVDTADAPYEFMHIFKLEEDNKKTPFSFIFTPVTGKKGDILNVTILSVYYPSFQPDMKETTSYGMYQSILPMELKMAVNEQIPPLDMTDIPKNECLENIEISTTPITAQTLQKFGGGMMGELSYENLSTDVYADLLFNSEYYMNYIKVGDAKSLHVTYTLCGVPDTMYTTTFYINHQPIYSAQGNSFTNTLVKGSMNVIEVDIDLSKLADFNTFYAISVPIKADDFPNAIIIPQKSLSILIYK